jgi:vancomycin resistance protein YoaR
LPWLLLALLVVVLALAIPMLYRQAYQGRIFPGVSVGGIGLGGLTPKEAGSQLTAAGVVPTALISVRADDRSWTLETGISGLVFDPRATLAAAYAVGRSGSTPGAIVEMLRARLSGRAIAPIVTVEEPLLRAAVRGLATEFDRPAVDAGIRFEGDTVTAVPAVSGRTLDQSAAIRALSTAALDRWPVPDQVLPFDEVAPTVADSAAAVDAARALLAQPVTLRAGDQTWTLPSQTLAPMLTTELTDAGIQLAVQPTPFQEWFRPVTQAISRTAESPRFHFNPDTHQLELARPGKTGQRVDAEATAAAVVTAAEHGHVVDVISLTVPPLVSDNIAAAELGITELVHSETSRYAGSPPERMKNIAVAATKFDGVLIPPEAVFSFNEYLGDVSLAEGFVKGKIIQDGATADGVGGGVCQVSTTLFRAAFWTGLPIVERQAHGYRVAYYEQGSPAGLDATIYSPYTDLKFRNDTGHWLLIETGSNSKRATVTFSLYGTKPKERTVRMEGPFIGSQVPPPPARVELDPSLPPGARVLAEASRAGSTVRVVRVVERAGAESRDTFMSGYRPTGALTQVGPAVAPAVAEVPPDAPVVTP